MIEPMTIPSGAADRHRQVVSRHQAGALFTDKQIEQDRRSDDSVGGLADPQHAPRQGQVAIASRQPAADGRQAPDADPHAEQPGPPEPVAQPAHDRAEKGVTHQEDTRQQAPLEIGDGELSLDLRLHRHQQISVEKVEHVHAEQSDKCRHRPPRRW